MRDDLQKLPLPPAAKRYARRSGLKQLGPAGQQLYLKVNKQLVNPTNSGVMRPRDVVGKVGLAKESLHQSTLRILGEEGPDDFGQEDHQERPDWSKAKFVKGGLPPGAQRVHMYPVQDVLRPRGASMTKESLSLLVHEKLKSAFEDWTSPSYGDSISPEKLTSLLRQNLDTEVQAAWDHFMDGV